MILDCSGGIGGYERAGRRLRCRGNEVQIRREKWWRLSSSRKTYNFDWSWAKEWMRFEWIRCPSPGAQWSRRANSCDDYFAFAATRVGAFPLPTSCLESVERKGHIVMNELAGRWSSLELSLEKRDCCCAIHQLVIDKDEWSCTYCSAPFLSFLLVAQKIYTKCTKSPPNICSIECSLSLIW